jgi:protein-S-isoprenylcysteine O-methyltransferase Ste14
MNYDYLVNLIIVINIVLTFSANVPLAGRAFKKKLQPTLTKADSYLQNVPKLISTLIFLMIIAGLFGIGKLEIEFKYLNVVRVISSILFVIFSWLQIYAIRQLEEFYSPDIVIFKNHKLIDKGLFKLSRHPIYLSQILQDFFAGLALVNLPIILLTILIELPLYVARTNLEEKYLEKYVTEYSEYKAKVGKWLPKIFNKR